MYTTLRNFTSFTTQQIFNILQHFTTLCAQQLYNNVVIIWQNVTQLDTTWQNVTQLYKIQNFYKKTSQNFTKPYKTHIKNKKKTLQHFTYTYIKLYKQLGKQNFTTRYKQHTTTLQKIYECLHNFTKLFKTLQQSITSY